MLSPARQNMLKTCIQHQISPAVPKGVKSKLKFSFSSLNSQWEVPISFLNVLPKYAGTFTTMPK